MNGWLVDREDARARARNAYLMLGLLEGLLAHVDCDGVLALKNGTAPLQGVLMALAQAREDVLVLREALEGEG